MSSSRNPLEAPFAAEGGLPSPTCVKGDPYRALDDLMAVVEILCPEWPRRNVRSPGGKMLM